MKHCGACASTNGTVPNAIERDKDNCVVCMPCRAEAEAKADTTHIVYYFDCVNQTSNVSVVCLVSTFCCLEMQKLVNAIVARAMPRIHLHHTVHV